MMDQRNLKLAATAMAMPQQFLLLPLRRPTVKQLLEQKSPLPSPRQTEGTRWTWRTVSPWRDRRNRRRSRWLAARKTQRGRLRRSTRCARHLRPGSPRRLPPRGSALAPGTESPDDTTTTDPTGAGRLTPRLLLLSAVAAGVAPPAALLPPVPLDAGDADEKEREREKDNYRLRSLAAADQEVKEQERQEKRITFSESDHFCVRASAASCVCFRYLAREAGVTRWRASRRML